MSLGALNQACKIRYFADWPLHTALGREEECTNYATGNYFYLLLLTVLHVSIVAFLRVYHRVLLPRVEIALEEVAGVGAPAEVSPGDHLHTVLTYYICKVIGFRGLNSIFIGLHLLYCRGSSVCNRKLKPKQTLYVNGSL